MRENESLGQREGGTDSKKSKDDMKGAGDCSSFAWF